MARSRWQLISAGAALALVPLVGGIAWAQPGSSAGAHPPVRQIGTVTYPPPLHNPTSVDISWVDPATQTDYVADRSNSGVAAINAVTGQFDALIGAGDFTGTGATATSAQKATCGSTGVDGPNGALTVHTGGVTQLWVPDGVDAASPVSTVKVFGLGTPASGTLATTISTQGSCRADELAYDPVDHLIVVANDVDSPPFLSFISVHPNPADDSVVGTIKLPNAIDGIEQSVWNPRGDKLYVNLPQVPTSNGSWMGEVAVIDPHSLAVTTSFPAPGCSPGGLALDVPTQQLLVGCSGDAISGDAVNGVTYPGNPAVTDIMDARSGRIVRALHQVGGSDEVWFDPAHKAYYLAASNMTSNGQASGYPAPVLGVITARGDRWLGNVPTAASAHSVAADPVNGHVFVPIPGKGIAVFEPARAGLR